ncbi:phosphate ABC transporter permease subunit PstC [Radicibacter daui]|uniref:phosphate ABC transporter permease subunit PstC n=1 Tax=Radicibacter daui TaxID=3064829 RepID=UPI004046FD71
MPLSLVLVVIVLLAALGYAMGRSRALAAGGGSARTLNSVPRYYGSYVALWAGLPSLVLLFIWNAADGAIIRGMVIDRIAMATSVTAPAALNLAFANVVNLANGALNSDGADPNLLAAAGYYNHLQDLSGQIAGALVLVLALCGLAYALRRVRPALRARNAVERVVHTLLMLSSLLAILTTVGIVLSLIFESIRFFTHVAPWDFLFGLQWSPQTALRADQVGSSSAFGAVPLFAGTLLIATIAMLVAVPVGLMSAIYLSEYASRRTRAVVKPLLEVLAGIPTVVYGFFAALTVAPFFRSLGQMAGLDVSSESALAAGIVMGIMIVPFVSSLSDDVINAVPQSLRDGSYGMGATRSETIRQVVLPAALPGIVGAFLLAVSRAVGETMIVVMAAGLAANLTFNPLEAVTTVTVQIATLLVGDQEFDSPKTLSVFALGLTLFLVTLCLNVIALRIVQKYREKYD